MKPGGASRPFALVTAPGIHRRGRMTTDETAPDLPIPDQGRGADSWLATLCAGRLLKIVGPSR
jgi:hypothetical protein